LIISLLTGWLYNQSNTSENAALTYSELINENDEGLVEQTNNSDKPQIITLSDGSSVLLQPNSKLSYPKIFVAMRKVYLSGEGFSKSVKTLKTIFRL
jgi:hypothetical protein